MAPPKLWGTTDTRNGLPTTTRESPDFSHGECQDIVINQENLNIIYKIEFYKEGSDKG